jgi:hypothetical protein
MPLRKATESAFIKNVFNPTNPQLDYGGYPFNGPAMAINNLKMRTTIWASPDRVTISLNKNNVWDRRLHEFKAPTLKDITEEVFEPINKNIVNVNEKSLRPITNFQCDFNIF